MFRLIGRHFKEAFQGIFRHFAMAISSISAVTVTLVLVSLLTIIIGNVSQITRHLQEEIQVYVEIEEDVEESSIEYLKSQVLRVDGVSAVEYSDKDNELSKMGEYYDTDIFEMYRQDNPLARAFIVSVKEGYTLSDVSSRIEKINGLTGINFGGVTTEHFIELLASVRNGGYMIVLALTLLAVFLIYNTIKITIYNRSEEIGIMRQVGASNSYIRHPFVIEGVFIGILGAALPIAATIFGYQYFYEEMNGQLLSAMFPIMPTYPFAYEVSAFLIIVGVVVGLIGSFLSVNKYLRWRR